MSETNNIPPKDIADRLATVIERIAEAMEAPLGIAQAIIANGGPYEASLLLNHRKKLREAATIALTIIVEAPEFRSFG